MRRKLHRLIVRQATTEDRPAWAAMLAKLHPDEASATFEAELAGLMSDYVGFLAFADDGEPIGMIDAMIRNYAEGAPNLRAAYVEDLWVEPGYRRLGVAAALLEAVENWARGQGLEWLGSDALFDNVESHAWHRASGFAEIERLTVFGKRLD